MRRKSILWCTGFIVLTSFILGYISYHIIHVDPFFHYHKPLTDEYFYSLNNQRSQNDGIEKHFEYEGLITGTSMTENFRASEAEELWGFPFVKVPFSGGTFKEINDNVKTAITHNPQLRVVVRGLDMYMFTQDQNHMRDDLGSFPNYLYDDNIFNDVQYLFNRDIVFSRLYPMIRNAKNNGKHGITSFDQYSNWMTNQIFGKESLYPDGVSSSILGLQMNLTEEEKIKTIDNIRQNVTSLAQAYPDILFYYFMTPYSAQWWQSQVDAGNLNKQIQAERLLIEETLQYDNIKLFSFNNLTDITTDLNHYKDITHYGEWINSMILRMIFHGDGLLTKDNYKAYLKEEIDFYSTFDYRSMSEQEDFENDYHAALMIAERAYGIHEKKLDRNTNEIQLSHAECIDNQYEGKVEIICQGILQRDYHIEEITVSDYLRDTDFVGCKFEIKDITPIHFIAFYGKKIKDHGQPSVFVYDSEGRVVAGLELRYNNLDNEWHEYILDVRNASGNAMVIFNGGYTDFSGNAESEYAFSNITIY